MDETALAYERLIENLIAWANGQDDVRAAVVIGSRARSDHPADRWSDLDVLIVASDPQRYCSAAGWLEAVGTPWLTFTEQTFDGGLERRVLFAGGLDVDFAFLPLDAARQMVGTAPSPDVADILRRGARVLLDKDGLVAQLRPSETIVPAPQPPTQAEFLQVVHDFWYHAVWTAKHLRRGELWWAKGGCDNHLKGLLRRMLEWHAQATKGPDCDTWMRGRFLEEWADERAVEQLRHAFAHYDEADVWRALVVTMDLFRWVALETAGRLGYPYPALGDERATEFVYQLRPEASSAP